MHYTKTSATTGFHLSARRFEISKMRTVDWYWYWYWYWNRSNVGRGEGKIGLVDQC